MFILFIESGDWKVNPSGITLLTNQISLNNFYGLYGLPITEIQSSKGLVSIWICKKKWLSESFLIKRLPEVYLRFVGLVQLDEAICQTSEVLWKSTVMQKFFRVDCILTRDSVRIAANIPSKPLIRWVKKKNSACNTSSILYPCQGIWELYFLLEMGNLATSSFRIMEFLFPWRCLRIFWEIRPWKWSARRHYLPMREMRA